MTPARGLAYVVPFHADVARLHRTIEFLRAGRERHGIAEVLLCHNGPALPAEVQAGLTRTLDPSFERLLHVDAPGVGAGYRLGIENAGAESIVLSASDLPFGFTDVEGWREEERRAGRRIPFAIGSKGHPRSRLRGRPLSRRVATLAFLWLRRAFLGRLTPLDSQGTFLGDTSLFSSLAREAPSDDWVFTLELATAWTRRTGERATEVPVTLVEEGHESSVSLASDGLRLLRGLARVSAGSRSG
ncbi:hypothetical protein KGQ64_05195 [bacterium]|nr:hypothetical protein [bacterium]